MRRYSLINNDGTSYELTEKGKSFFFDVDGLGYKCETEFQRIGEHLALINDHLAQGVVTGSIKFWQPNAYQQYFKFAQFCQNKPLKLLYTPPTGTTYYREGYVTAITKRESDALVVSIEFKATTPWYKSVYVFNSGEIAGGKVYDYTYNYTYAEGAAQSVIINSDSYKESPCKITLYGPLVNPSWSHYLNNELIVVGSVKGTIEEGNKLVIDTTTIPYSIKQFDAGDNLISNMYQLSDFSTYRFVNIGFGENIISATHEALSTIKIGVEAKIEYATV